MMTGIQRLQATQYQTSLDRQAHHQEGVENAVDAHASKVEESYDKALLEIEKDKQARKTQSIFTLLGAIFMGPLIGSMIGSAIGGAANDGAEGASREAKKDNEIATMEADKAFDAFQDARGELEDAQAQQRDVAKFARELRDMGWTGTNG